MKRILIGTAGALFALCLFAGLHPAARAWAGMRINSLSILSNAIYNGYFTFGSTGGLTMTGTLTADAISGPISGAVSATTITASGLSQLRTVYARNVSLNDLIAEDLTISSAAVTGTVSAATLTGALSATTIIASALSRLRTLYARNVSMNDLIAEDATLSSAAVTGTVSGGTISSSGDVVSGDDYVSTGANSTVNANFFKGRLGSFLLGLYAGGVTTETVNASGNLGVQGEGAFGSFITGVSAFLSNALLVKNQAHFGSVITPSLSAGTSNLYSLNVTQDADIGTDLRVADDIVVTGDADIVANTSLGGYLYGTWVWLTKNLGVVGEGHFGSVATPSLSAGTSFLYSLSVTEDTWLYGDLAVSGTISDPDSAVTLADLTVTSNSTLNGASNVFYGNNTFEDLIAGKTSVAANVDFSARKAAAGSGVVAKVFPFPHYHVLPGTCTKGEAALHTRAWDAENTVVLYACATTDVWQAMHTP